MELGRIKEAIFNCNVIIVTVAVLSISGMFFIMAGTDERWIALFIQLFAILVSAIVTIWIAGKVAREAAVKGAEAGGKAAREAAIEGAKKAASLELKWRRFERIENAIADFVIVINELQRNKELANEIPQEILFFPELDTKNLSMTYKIPNLVAVSDEWSALFLSINEFAGWLRKSKSITGRDFKEVLEKHFKPLNEFLSQSAEMKELQCHEVLDALSKKREALEAEFNEIDF